MKVQIINLFLLSSFFFACKNRLVETNIVKDNASITLIEDSLEIIEIKQFKKLDFLSHICKNGLDDNYQNLILDSLVEGNFDSKKDIVIFITPYRLYHEYRNYFINNSTNKTLLENIRQNINSGSCNLDFKRYGLSNSKNGISYYNESFMIVKSNRSFIKGKLSCVDIKTRIENIFFITPFCDK